MRQAESLYWDAESKTTNVTKGIPTPQEKRSFLVITTDLYYLWGRLEAPGENERKTVRKEEKIAEE
jgi:hypothetical protein